MKPTLRLDPALLRTARLEQALSQRALGLKANLRAATISDIENGTPARVGTIKALADALGVKPTDIARLG